MIKFKAGFFEVIINGQGRGIYTTEAEAKKAMAQLEKLQRSGSRKFIGPKPNKANG